MREALSSLFICLYNSGMKKRIPFFVVTCILVAGIIVGSFYDFQINKALFSNRNPFGVFWSAFGLSLGYCILALFGGALGGLAYRNPYQKWLKAILYGFGVICFGAAVYFTGCEVCSNNGYMVKDIGWNIFSYAMTAIFDAGFVVLGFILSKNIKNPKAWIGILILILALIIALVPGVTLLKSIMHRPRYRTVQLGIEGITFHQWWNPFPEYKEYISETVLKEEFKSFPSGHAGASMLAAFTLFYLPVFIPKLKGKENLLFSIGACYCFFIAFTRMLVGAHYLSDVSFGALLTLTFMWIAKEIAEKYKLFDDPVEAQ